MLLLGEHYVILARVLSIRIELVRSHLSMKGSSAFVCLAWDSKVLAVAMDHEFRFDDVSDSVAAAPAHSRLKPELEPATT